MNILIISAHPDDDVIGIGGIISKLTMKYNAAVYSIILSQGCEGYDDTKNIATLSQMRQSECQNAHSLLEISETKILNYPDCNLLSFKREITKDVIKKIRNLLPEIIFTHTSDDIHPDHITTNTFVKEAIIVSATDLWPDLGNRWIVKYLYEFDGLRSQIKNPTHVIDITGYIETKIMSLRKYESQINRNPNLIDLIKRIDSYRGVLINCEYAEALKRIYLFPIVLNTIEGMNDE